MTKRNKPDQNLTYEVITQRDEETGDLLLPLPLELLESMGWKPGDTLDFALDDKGKWVIKKA